MLENMFVGRPPGNYDRILDFSRAVTGNLFFVPSATFLENFAEDQPNEVQTKDRTNEDQSAVAASTVAPAIDETASSIPSSISSVRDGSLGIGSLKGDLGHE
jgi:putative iron-dependent peroxidase